MHKPTWATVMGIFIILIGGCGGCYHGSNVATSGLMDGYDAALNEEFKDAERRDSLYEEDRPKKNIEDMDSMELVRLKRFTDTLIVDEDNNIDMTATMSEGLKISDYRKTWFKRFAYIKLFTSILFLIAGIMLLATRKFTIQTVLIALAFSLAVGIFQIFIYAGDPDSGGLINKWGNAAAYVSIFFDVILLIIFLVVDKSYYKPAQGIVEDYYDD